MSLTPPNNLSAVSLTPVSFSAVSLTPAKNVRLFDYFPVTRINDTGDKFFAGVVDTAEQYISGVVCTGNKYSFANISANFQKNSKRAPMEYLGAWGTLIHEKNLKSKISRQTPFKGRDQ
jgi:hypothetical protein